MTPEMILAELQARGLEIRVEGDRIRYRPVSAMPAELLQAVRAHKPALLELLRTPPSNWTAPTLLDELVRHGVRLEAHDAGLRVASGSPAIPRDMVGAVMQHAVEIAALLRQSVDLLEHAELREERRDAVAWKLWSRKLELEVWMCRDRATAEELWAETGQACVTLIEWQKLGRMPLELIRSIIAARIVFGPAGVALGEVRGLDRNREKRSSTPSSST